MTAKHTPGPWTVEDPMGPDILSIVEAGKRSYEWRFIATVSLDDDEDDDIPRREAEANAILLAEAPNLLAALAPFAAAAEHDIGATEADADTFRQAEGSYNRAPKITVGDVRRALAAVRKARGEP